MTIFEIICLTVLVIGIIGVCFIPAEWLLNEQPGKKIVTPTGTTKTVEAPPTEPSPTFLDEQNLSL